MRPFGHDSTIISWWPDQTEFASYALIVSVGQSLSLSYVTKAVSVASSSRYFELVSSKIFTLAMRMAGSCYLAWECYITYTVMSHIALPCYIYYLPPHAWLRGQAVWTLQISKSLFSDSLHSIDSTLLLHIKDIVWTTLVLILRCPLLICTKF